MSEILPKDLLKHLEKGDRSAEFIETQVEGALTVETIRDAVAQMRNVDPLNDIQRMEQQMRDMQQMQNQYMQNVGMASAQMFTRPGGIVRWG